PLGGRPETRLRGADGQREYCPVDRVDAVPRPARPAPQTLRSASARLEVTRPRRGAPDRPRVFSFAAPASPAAARPSHDPPTPHARVRFRSRPETRVSGRTYPSIDFTFSRKLFDRGCTSSPERRANSSSSPLCRRARLRGV